MKIESKELRGKDRANLVDVLPLQQPWTIFIDPSGLCNLKCTFCPTGIPELAKKRPSGIMNLEVFKKIVDGCKDFKNKIKQFNIYKDGEPLLNPHFIDMVKYLKNADIADRIWTKTNGIRLTPDINTQLVDSGLDMIGISVKQLSPDGYVKVAGVKVDYQKFLVNLQDLYSKRGEVKIFISIADTLLTEDERVKFFADFEAVSDYITIEGLHNWTFSSNERDFRLGTDNSLDGTPLQWKLVCPLPMYTLAFNYNGTVSVCNDDWEHKTVIGDITKQTVSEIWNSPERYEFVKMHLEGRRFENSACATCQAMETLPDNIDEDRLTILKNVTDGRLN